MIFARLKRLWQLSKYEIKDETLFWKGQPVQNDLRIVRAEPPSQKAVFIPRIIKDPGKAITEEKP